MFEIPLTSDPEQIFSTDLEGVIYNFRVYYNTRSEDWSMDLLDSDSNCIVAGLKLVLNVDIIGPYPLTEIGAFVMLDLENTNIDATADDLGDRVRLYYVTVEELENELAL